MKMCIRDSLKRSPHIFPAQSGKLNAPPSHRAVDAALQIGMDGCCLLYTSFFTRRTRKMEVSTAKTAIPMDKKTMISMLATPPY